MGRVSVDQVFIGQLVANKKRYSFSKLTLTLTNDDMIYDIMIYDNTKCSVSLLVVSTHSEPMPLSR